MFDLDACLWDKEMFEVRHEITARRHARVTSGERSWSHHNDTVITVTTAAAASAWARSVITARRTL